MRPILLLGGVTAAGKSALAQELALAWDAALVSADAMTVYRGLDIGTAKPSPEERAAVPTYAIDVCELDEAFDVAAFLETVAEARAAHERVIVVGGTPFYLQALVRPMAELPAPDPAVRAALEALPDPHGRLAHVDPAAAARLHPNDRVRVIRALEVHALTGRTQTELHAEGPAVPPVPSRVVWLDREDVAERIALRLQQMVARGYVEETRRVLAAGWDRELKPLRSFSYKHLVAHVLDGLSLEEALRRTDRDTRRFSRKQRTWARGLGWTATTADSVRRLAAELFT